MHITSYVFFDIETTGLPFQERNRTKITELSFIAALRKDIENTKYGDMPLVSKLTLVFNPEKQIHPEVVALTGHTNELLQYAPTFKQKALCITLFLNELPQPVCLVAHNGNIFDYKILLAECIDAGIKLPQHVLCVDSLIGFRKLLKGTNLCYKDLESSSDLLTDDEDWPDLNVSTEEWQDIDEICLSLSDISCEDFVESETEIKVKKNVKQKVLNVKKEKESYALGVLYKRLLNREECNAHRAEIDCIMLLHCVVALKTVFLPWADDSCKLLSEIKPLLRK